MRIFSFEVFNKRLHNYVWRHAMNIFINIDVLAFLAILPFGQKLTDFILTKRTSTPGSSTHYIRSRSTFPVVLFHWAFYSGFSWRAAYHSYVIVIPTMLSLCIFYGSGILLIKRWSYHRQPKRTMCGFGLQRSFGRNILELLVYYLMLNKRKNLKDMNSSCLSICASSL